MRFPLSPLTGYLGENSPSSGKAEFLAGSRAPDWGAWADVAISANCAAALDGGLGANRKARIFSAALRVAKILPGGSEISAAVFFKVYVTRGKRKSNAQNIALILFFSGRREKQLRSRERRAGTPR